MPAPRRLRRAGAAWAAVALAGCVKYGRVENPIPVQDLEAAVTIENVMRTWKQQGREAGFEVYLRVHAPADSVVRIPVQAIQLYARGDTLTPLVTGALRLPVEAPRQALEIAPGTRARLPAEVALPPALRRTGQRFFLRTTWQEGLAGRPGVVQRQSRLFRFCSRNSNGSP